VLTPELLDSLLQRADAGFRSELSERKKGLLHTIYDLPAYHEVLPALEERQAERQLLVGVTGAFSVQMSGDVCDRLARRRREPDQHGNCPAVVRRLSWRTPRMWLGFRSTSGVEMKIQLGPPESQVSSICGFARHRELADGIYGFPVWASRI
jgi:hypothetical protein